MCVGLSDIGEVEIGILINKISLSLSQIMMYVVFRNLDSGGGGGGGRYILGLNFDRIILIFT